MFLSRSTERQAGNDSQKQKTKKAELTNIFCVYLFFRVYLFSRNIDFVHISRVFIFANDV